MSGERAFLVHILGGAEFPCPPDRSVLSAMIAARSNALPVGCRGGGCGVCRVRVRSGRFTLGKMSREQVTIEDEQQGFALACRLVPLSTLILEPAPRRHSMAP